MEDELGGDECDKPVPEIYKYYGHSMIVSRAWSGSLSIFLLSMRDMALSHFMGEDILLSLRSQIAFDDGILHYIVNHWEAFSFCIVLVLWSRRYKYHIASNSAN